MDGVSDAFAATLVRDDSTQHAAQFPCGFHFALKLAHPILQRRIVSRRPQQRTRYSSFVGGRHQRFHRCRCTLVKRNVNMLTIPDFAISFRSPSSIPCE